MAGWTWDIDTRGLDEMIAQLEGTTNNIQQISDQAVQAGADVVKGALSGAMPRWGGPPHTAGKTNSWRPGGHAADDVQISAPKTSGVGNRYVVIGAGSNAKTNNNERFYMRLVMEGVAGFGRRGAGPCDFVGEAKGAAASAAIEAMKDVLRAVIENGG